ncbi:hypothetical protein Tco_1032452 [Tanacetum coccineum]|uniref:UBN2 domain-containing protein n=1 Tax=Tanacetum coccineum TaxID=301880 RepID=A0ABQ5GDA2_9ASTR
MQIEYDSLCEISLKIINKNKILKTKRDLLEKEILKLNEKIKKLERIKEIEIACKSCDIWKSLLITHQGNSQVKDNKIDLLVQQYEQFNILEEESIDSGCARFNTIITSLKALDESFSSKNNVNKLIRNLKVHEVVIEKDSEIYRGKKERIKSIALKAKKESSDNQTSTSRSDDEEYDMAVRNFKKFFRRKDAVIQIISLAIVQNYLTIKIKRPSLEDLGAISRMTSKTKLTMILVSWLNHQMRYA